MKVNGRDILAVLVSGLLLSRPGVGFAASPGTTGASVLSIPTGARAIAMGEAYTAMADDVSSLYWNPGGIAFMNQSQASFVYNQFVDDLTYNNASVATAMEYGGLGASVSYLSYGDITATDTNGDPTGNVNAYSSVGTLGGSFLGNNWAAGVNVKGIQDSLADEKANGFAGDLGLSMVYPQPIWGNGTARASFVVRNMGSGMKFINQKDPLPQEWRLGLAAVQMFDKKLNLSLDYGQQRSQNSAVYAGAEYWVMKYLALRTGYAGNKVEGSPLRAGVGLRIRDISFDYSFSDYGDLGLTHRYELIWRFGMIYARLSPEERALLRRAKIALKNGRYGEATMLFDAFIQLVPNYRPAQKLVKVAMAGYEKASKDELAMNGTILKVQQRPMSPYEANELKDMEALLGLTEESPHSVQATSGLTKEKRP